MDVSIFIRARNEAKYISRCLAALFSQESPLDFEVILLDSESDDRTIDEASKYDIRIYQIPKSLFHYASALNLGLRLAKGELFVALSAHCIPQDSFWLHQLTLPLLESSNIGASYSRQIAWPEASSIEAILMSRAFPGIPRLTTPEAIGANYLTPINWYDTIHFSNASSCIKCDLARQSPFRELPFSEDRAFAYDCLRAGQSIAYCPSSVVYHSHAPVFGEFRKVAYQATVARQQISILFAEDDLLEEPSTPTIVRPGLKLLLIIPVTILLMLGDIILLKWHSEGMRKFFRLLQFRFASVGTSLGKFEATLRLRMSKATIPTPMDDSPLLRRMKCIKE